MKISRAIFVSGIIIFPLLLCLLPVDSINGFLLRNNNDSGLSVSQLFKFPVLFLMLTTVIMDARSIVSLLSISTLLFVPSLLNFSILPNEILKDLINLSKWLTPILSYYFFKQIWKHQPKLSKLFDSWIYFSYAVVAINILVSLLGYGFPMYSNVAGQTIGTRGFFFAGNELSVTLLVLYSFIDFKLIRTKLRIPFLLFNLFLSLLISSKTGIIGILVVYFIISRYQNKLRFNTRQKMLRLFGLSIVTPVLGTYLYNALVSSPLWDRLLYFFSKLDFITFILSGRNLFLINNLELFFIKYHPIVSIFGLGYSEYSKSLQKMVEIDIFDIFFTFGIIGVLIFTLTIIIHLTNTFKENFKDFPNNYYSFYICFVLLMTSSMTGHTFNSGMAGIFIGYALSYFYLKTKYD